MRVKSKLFFCTTLDIQSLSNMQVSKINVVWFKRDLRLSDHGPLCAAIEAGLPTLLLFCLEPRLMNAPDAASRHWRFAWQSAAYLKEELERNGHGLQVVHQDALPVFEQLAQHHNIHTIFSHQETGNKASFDRDREMLSWCRDRNIQWAEFSQDGVLRGRKHRHGWAKRMERFLEGPLLHPDLKRLKPFRGYETLAAGWKGPSLPASILQDAPDQQVGGAHNAQRYWQSFLEGRGANYGRHLSKPHLSRLSCSRLSPYLAWGNIGIREIWQHCKKHETATTPMGRALRNLRERLWWRGHYLQKLEAEWEMEFDPINRGFKGLGRVLDERRYEAWKKGETGFPMVDASMRCLMHTGWLNFRMRAMLATFATFTLWLPYRPVALYLAKLFLDYEPGIHYPQLQMQAGLTGYHTLRIYNPVVQAAQHDPEGHFIHKWIPELRNIPAPQCHHPWKLTLMEQQFYQFQAGEDYPALIVDFDSVNAEHRERYWQLRNSEEVRKRLPAIWERHCLPENIRQYQKGLLSDVNETGKSKEIH
jgi:deoxyribodipyrimidine photo-lyase